MPCSDGPPDFTDRDREFSRLVMLKSELSTGMKPDPKEWQDGIDYRVDYAPIPEAAIRMMRSEVCQMLQSIDDFSAYSLELQIWWRDHKQRDKQRVNAMIQAKKDAGKIRSVEQLNAYLKTLNEYEASLVGDGRK